jgi:hypothetical protein
MAAAAFPCSTVIGAEEPNEFLPLLTLALGSIGFLLILANILYFFLNRRNHILAVVTAVLLFPGQIILFLGAALLDLCGDLLAIILFVEFIIALMITAIHIYVRRKSVLR